ncbi:MAG: phosphate-starvation-inducible PsiE family protein [Nitrospirae bacterium]|nr:phosphate-starvation-inducible PsiE family protein [Nitrospirota bacterium]
MKKINISEYLKDFLIKIDMLFHAIAALLLFIACGYVLYYAAANLADPTRVAVIALVNDVLLALIILELLWTVIRFLKKQKFSLAPFLAIGVIASIRRILLIEAQGSAMETISHDKLIEIGVTAVVVIIFMIGYYLAVKAQRLEQ